MRLPPLLIWQLTGRGLGSEVLLMLLARLYATSRNYDFALASRYSNIAWQRGWSDYFEPFCKEISHPLAFEDSVFRTLGSLPRRCARSVAARVLGVMHRRRVLFSFHVWKSIWTPEFVEGRFRLPGLDSGIDAYSALSALIREVWRPTEATRSAIAHRTGAVKPFAPRFVGIHIRRGDKWQEAGAIPVEAYARRVEQVDPSIRECFVASDSHAAVRELAAARPGWNVSSLVAPDDDGHHQAAFNVLSPEARRERMLDLLAELEILRRADFFVGSFSSNIGVLMALQRGIESCHGVDGPLRIYRPY